MIGKDFVYSQLEASANMPVLPEVLLTLLAACDDAESSLGDIAGIISRDPSLSLRVLQLVNSAYYGFRHTFAGIRQAVVYLGATTIKNLAITASVFQVFANKAANRKALDNSTAFWHHSLLTATIARRLALETSDCCSEEVYLAGLLHDIGKLLLSTSFPEMYDAQNAAAASNSERLQWEQEAIGLSHANAGSWLVRRWNLGSLIADAIEFHHEPVVQVSEAFPIVKIVYLANILATYTLPESEIERIAATLFGQGFCAWEDWLGDAAEEVEQVAESMGIVVKPPAESAQADSFDLEHFSERQSDESEGQESLFARVRNMSLLVAFQEELMQAGKTEAMLATMERAMAILFDINRVLCFLPDDGGVLLQARVSEGSHLQSAVQGLTLSIRQNTSLIVTAYVQQRDPGLIVRDRQGASIADQQLLAVLESERLLPLVMKVDGDAVGVVVVGLPTIWQQVSEDDRNLLGIIIQQVAMCLYLEREKLRKEEMLRQERMTAISTTARKFAHEINNPLGVISNYLMILRHKIGVESEVLGDLAIIDEEIQRISTMIDQMEMYSQAPFSRFEPVDLNVVVRDILQIVKPSLFSSGGLSVSFIPGTDLPRLITAKDAIKQVLINLLKNAAEAMAEGGRVIVRTRRSQPEGGTDSDGVELIISDSGPGLPETVAQNLYKPFVTTKQGGHSGLGLSIVQKVVSEIGGKLSCQSSPEKGTTFTIYLPVMVADGPK